MANKINEIIDVLNSGETVEGLTARVDSLEDELGSFEEQTNESIGNLAGSLEETDLHVSQVTNYLDNWQLVSDTELSSIITAGKLNTDILICIGNTSNEYADYIEGEQFMYLPKGASAISRNFTFMFGGHWYPESEVTRKCNLSRVYLRGSNFTSVDAHYVTLYVVIYDLANGTWDRQEIQFYRRDYSSNTPYILFYKRVLNGGAS